MKQEKKNTKELVRYLIFGVLTTIVYILTRFLVLSMANNTTLALCVAQTVAILFAFVTNKWLVFQDKRDKQLFVQFLQFLSARLLGWAIDFAISFLCIEKGTAFFVKCFHLNLFHYNEPPFSWKMLTKFCGTAALLNQLIWTLFIQVLIIVLNYLISKWIVFKKDEKSRRFS